MSGAYYSEDDFQPRSPGLERVFPKAAPSPSPPPVVTQVYHPPVSSPSSRRRKKANRRKTRPTQGDWVLIREMDPNRPDIAQQVSQNALNSDSGSSSDDEEDMEDQVADTAVVAPAAPNGIHPVRTGAQPFSLHPPAKDALSLSGQHTATSQHRDSVVEADIKSGTVTLNRRPSDVSHLPNGTHSTANDAGLVTPVMTASLPLSTSPSQSSQRNGSIVSTYSRSESSASNSLQQLQIPPSRGDTLPALQPQSPPRDAASPNTQLPSISHMVGHIGRSASISEEGGRPNNYAHRPSISSSIGQSPISSVRQLSISSHGPSPSTPFPSFSASSPISANNTTHSRDPFLQSGSGHIFRPDARRPSQASENGKYPSTIHSTSPSEGYQSSDGPSPGAQQTPIETRPRMQSMDGTISQSAIILPPPHGSGIQHVASHGAGTFRCEYPGCNALPFQTQYLLK